MIGRVGQNSVEQLCRERGVSQPTYYAWNRKYTSMNEPDMKRLREMEKENARLKRLLAEREFAIDVMKEFLENVAGRRAFARFAVMRKL
jgi:putative transposase